MKKTFAAVAAIMTLSGAPQAALAGDTPWIGEVTTVGFNWCPRGWAEMNGQILKINDNTALFSLIGTIYGGDGRTTFALPDMRGRTGVHMGTGPGLSNRKIGAKYGAENVTLNINQIPAHTHNVTTVLHGSNLPGASSTPEGAVPALSTAGQIYRTPQAGAEVNLDSSAAISTAGNSGGGGSHPNMQPSVTMTYCMALVGTYPSRN